MAFSKTFPRTVDGSNYPRWEEVFLTKKEEEDIETKVREENKILMQQCILDAKDILKKQNLKGYETNIMSLAIALFEKRASHAVYHKENKAKEKFDSMFGRK